MVEPIAKITASGVHPSGYGEVGELARDTSIVVQKRTSYLRSLKAPLIIFFTGLVVLCLFSWNWLKGPSPDIHFALQAEAFLAGQLELLERPPHQNDWASYDEWTLNSGQVVRGIWYNRAEDKFLTLAGEMLILDRGERRGARRSQHYFVSFPPGPAVMMMPLVALWGQHVNDVWFTLFFAALNMALMYVLLRRVSWGGRSDRSPQDNVWLTVLFGFGTVALWCSVMGQVWFTALVVGITFTLLYLLCAIDARRPILAGLFMACAFATRTPLLFSAILFPIFAFFPGGRWVGTKNLGRAVRKTALFCLFPLVVGCGLLWMNYLRFERFTEFGHTYLANGQLDRIRDYGLFNYHFLAKNLSTALTLLPRFQPHAPYVQLSKHGMSILLTTPVWIYLLRPRPRQFRQDVLWHRALWVVVAMIAIPHLFYQNTGWSQFGYRFSMDYTPYLILLLAIGRFPLTRMFKFLVLVGIVVNGFGAITFNRMMDLFYVDWFFDP